MPFNDSLGLSRNAFTLAEVLITLGIIGVVAAMTMPTVLNNIQDKQYKSAFKKQYSAVSQAMLKVYADEGTTYEQIEWQNLSKYVCKVGKQLKYLKSGLKCDEILQIEGDVGDPNLGLSKNVKWHSEGQWYDKTGKKMSTNPAFNRYTFLLSDGAMINFNSVNQIFIDVNGFKKPNTIGKDIFYCFLPDKESTPTFFKKSGENLLVNGYACPDNCTSINKANYKEDCENGSGWGCSPLYILD